MRISLVVAAARNGVIGRGGALPWHLPGDLKRFKALTLGKPTLMGRRTWDSLPRRPLPGRENIVLSRGAEPGPHAGALWFRDLTAAIAHARSSGAEELCVIGGAEVFAKALPLADVIHLTAIEQDVDGDTVMPPWGDGWVEARATPVRHENGLAFRYVDYERVR